MRERQREQTSAAILDAAEESFAEKGLANAHMNDIATRVGVAVGTLYNHFKDRDSLLAALLENRRAELLARIDAFLDRAPGTFRDDLAGFVGEMGAFFEQHSRFHIILHRMEWGLNQDSYPATAACAPEMKRELFLRMEKLMRRGVKQKALRPQLAEYYAYLLMGIMRSIRLYHVDNNVEGYMPLDEVVRFFMEGAGA
ncbi:MAG TPA: TetR/AcrR family transcriptional regulator [Polyangia bacterium]|nr:TetR/AcrR family transcriptional regulator [Polyangia bacterium]